MGTWGPGPLDGDDALDVLDEFERNPTTQPIDDALSFVLQPDYDGVEWERALAAAEVVAVMKGHPAVKRASTHEQIIQLVRKESLVPTQALVAKALLVCDRA